MGTVGDSLVGQILRQWWKTEREKSCGTWQKGSWIAIVLNSDASPQRIKTCLLKRRYVRSSKASIVKAQSGHNIPASRVLNLDESGGTIGIFYGVAPQYIFVPEGSRSGEVPSGDDKSRFPVDLTATGDGKILPHFIVIKCSDPSGASANPYHLNLVMPSLEGLSSSEEEEEEDEGVGQMDVTQRDLRARKRC